MSLRKDLTPQELEELQRIQISSFDTFYSSRLKQEVLNVIEEHHEIVATFNLVDYDHQMNQLADQLWQFRNTTFGHNQRLLIIHHDTDYYPSINSMGNTLYNFFRLVSDFGLPCEKILILTNLYGLEEEVKMAARTLCNSEPPVVIRTHYWYDFPQLEKLDTTYAVKHPLLPITHLYTCFNGQKRSHRLLLLCWLAELGLLDHGMLSYFVTFNHYLDKAAMKP
jgi:hypothetical protein